MNNRYVFEDAPQANIDNRLLRDITKLYFIKDVFGDKREEISLSVIPDKVAYAYSPNFTSQSLIGRLSPIFMYTGGSPETFSFSVTLHEDIIDTAKYQSLIGLVDKFKSFMYPVETPNQARRFPTSYFQIGELSGYGIIKVSPSWKKPFRDGRYIMVDLSFSITIERSFQKPSSSVISQTNEQVVIFDYHISSGISREEWGDIKSSMHSTGYAAAASDFMQVGLSDDVTAYRIQAAKDRFFNQQDRLTKILKLFQTAGASEAVKDTNIFNRLAGFSTKSVELFTADDTEADAIKKAKDAFIKYLDYYYENINTDMTRTEYNKVKSEVFGILESLQYLAEEVIGYGAGS